MKFAYVNDKNWKLDNADMWHVNIGEYIQFYAEHMVFEYMKIPDDMVWTGSEEELHNYDGEEELILLASNLSGLDTLSPKIHPVYVGWHKFGYAPSKAEVIHLKKMDTLIGCRDENAYEQLVQKGVNAYIGGCISIALPRKNESLGQKVYIVDAPYEVLQYIPKELRKNAIVKHHEYYFDAQPERDEILKLVRDQYMEYYQNAKLVITSRLHLAAPCVAWGIPVILVRRTPFVTFSWIDKFVPIYLEKDFDSIDWNPPAIDLEYEKGIILRDVSYRLMQEYYKHTLTLDTHRLYKNRDVKVHYYKTLVEGVFEYLKNNVADYDDEFEYAIWGITANADILYEWITENYKNAHCVYAIDQYKHMNFHGIETVEPQKANLSNMFLFVIPTGAVQAAKQFVQGISLRGCYYVTETFVEQTDI